MTNEETKERVEKANEEIAAILKKYGVNLSIAIWFSDDGLLKKQIQLVPIETK